MTNKIDPLNYLCDDGPAALVIREHLMPVEGQDGVLFPPTYASGDGFKGGYNIDHFGDLEENKNVCLIDSVGSQANRIEPIFAEDKYSELIPQVVIQAGEHSINLVEAGHRAGDALARCSELQEELHDAFKSVLMGDAEPLAKIAPTSLVFGVWDSRDTQAKLPRLVASTIRAFNVQILHRSAQFVPATEYVAGGLLEEAKDKKASDAYSERGFNHVPATWSDGGVIAEGGIRRDATLSLAALKTIHAGNDPEKTAKLREYILGLSLVAFTANTSAYLRQGCCLVVDPDKGTKLCEVYRDGRRQEITLPHEEAIELAKSAAKNFEIGENREVNFDKRKAKDDVKKKD